MDLTATEEGWLKLKQALSRLEPAMRVAVEAGLGALVVAAGQSSGDESAAEAERWAGEVARRVTRPLLEARLQSRLDAEDRKVGGPNCSCGAGRKSQGMRSRTWASLFGPLSLKRRYLHSREVPGRRLPCAGGGRLQMLEQPLPGVEPQE